MSKGEGDDPVDRWIYREYQPVGRDDADPGEAGIYDASHADFRDMEAESRRVLDLLQVNETSLLIDLGCGTGTFAVAAAHRCRQVHAVDVSPAMLRLAEAKAGVAGRRNVVFHHAGFLSYEYPTGQADVVTSTFAFQHLPDFWKGVALDRISGWLKPGGLFYLHDVILEPSAALENIQAFIDRQETAGGEFLRDDTEGHFRDEFSTYDWVMDGLLERAGFAIREKTMDQGVLGTYLAVKA